MAKKEVKDALKLTPKPDGSEGNPLPWVAPFPAREFEDGRPLDSDGKPMDQDQEDEHLFVRAKVKQDLIVNGVKASAGTHITVTADFAHGHGAALEAPDPILPKEEDDESEDDES